MTAAPPAPKSALATTHDLLAPARGRPGADPPIGIGPGAMDQMQTEWRGHLARRIAAQEGRSSLQRR